MKTKEFADFKVSLNLSIEIDGHLRRITEKIRLLSQYRAVDSLKCVSDFLAATDADIDRLFEDNVVKDSCDE